MAQAKAPILRRWDGRTKTATAWSFNTPEPDLCPSAANCYIHLSDEHRHDHAQQPSPSFKVTFDQLVVKQCQPLLKNLTLDFSSSDSSISACHLDRPKGNRASWDIPLSLWTCSLTLPPPKLASEDDALLYNVTTRNFFAWLVGASIVGYNPTSALVALKSRMDIWRAPSCDNVAALQDYARSQSYGYLAGLHLVNTSLLRSTPFIPSDYTLAEPIDDPKPPTSDLSKPLQFGQSLRKRAGSILKRRSEGAKGQESFSSRPSSAPVQSGVPDTGLNGLTFMSGALSDDSAPPKLAHIQSMLDEASWLGSAYDAISDNSKSSSTSTATDKSSGLNTVSSKTTTDTEPDLPEPDATYGTQFKDFAESSSWLPDFSQNRPRTTNGLLHQSPTSVDPPRSYSNAANRHSFSGDRRRPHSQSRPPSPIMEEAIEPVKRRQPRITTGTTSRLRRLSLPPAMNRTGSESNNVSSAASVKTARQPSQDDDRSLHSTVLPRLSTDSTSTICTNCNRCKKPGLPTTHVPPQSSTPTTSCPVPQPDPSPARAVTSAQPFLSEGRWLSAKSKSKNILREEVPTRFPSLRRRGRSSTLPSAPDLPQDARAQIATYTGRLRAASQTALVTRPVMFETVSTEAAPRRSLDQSPLSQQRYSPPMHTATTTEQDYIPRTLSYTITEQHHTPPAQMPTPTELHSPIQRAPPTERRISQESFRVRPLQLRISTPVVTAEDRTKPDLPNFPEPMSSVIMKSNGSKVSLALPYDENTSLSLHHPFFTEKALDNVSETKYDQLVFDQLLDGLQFIDKTPKATAPRSYFSGLPEKESGVTTGFPYANSKLVPTNASKSSERPISPVTKPRRSTWTGFIRGWLSKDKSQNDAEPDSMARPMSKGSGVQVRVLTLDSHGRFSTSMMDSPIEGMMDWRS